MNNVQDTSGHDAFGSPDELDTVDLSLVMKHLQRKLGKATKAGRLLFAAKFPCGDFTQYVVMSGHLKDLCNVFYDGQTYRSVCLKEARVPNGAQLVEAAPIDDREWEKLARMPYFQRRLKSTSPSRRARELAQSMVATQFKAGGTIGNVLVFSDECGEVDVVVQSPGRAHRHVAHVGVPSQVASSV